MAYKHLMKQREVKPVLPYLDPVAYEEEQDENRVIIPFKRAPIDGTSLLYDARFNKQNAFTPKERQRYNLHGLLPGAVEDDELQMRREVDNIEKKPNNLEKYIYLQNLLDRNVTLFYKVMCENVAQYMPLVYTPTVGKACQEYSHIFTKPKGIYITINDKGSVHEILQNWPVDDVKAIVFTDGERILGLGDLGINGMGIPVGKLQLYSACAGIPHHQCLPVCIDVGTNNQELLKDELYMGLKQKRVRDPSYDELVVEFMHAAQVRWGRTILLQFEDFGNHNAFRLLDMTREKFTTFNDDIQGTAAVSLAGVIAALRMKDVPNKLADHKIVFLGAGEAGTGIANLIAYAKKEENPDITINEARENIWLCDSKGLVHAGRTGLAEHKKDFAHPIKLKSYKFEDVVAEIKPTLLIGVSGTPKAFTPKILKQMAKNHKVPLIFALSNPTSKAECTAEEAYTNTDFKCVFASGSPFDPVPNPKKKNTFLHPGQGNNAYIFPGLALGIIASGACRVPEELMYISATSLAAQVQKSDFKKGSLYPPLDNIRDVSLKIAIDVADKAYTMGIATNLPKPADLGKYITSKVQDPVYQHYA